jgi:hypothetical protein
MSHGLELDPLIAKEASFNRESLNDRLKIIAIFRVSH